MSMARGSTATSTSTVSQQQGPGRPRSSSGRALTWDGRNPAVRLPPVLMEELELMSHGVAVVRRKSKVTYADIIAWLLDQCPEQVAQVKALCPPEIRAKFLPRSGDSVGDSPPQLLASPAAGPHSGTPGIEGMDVIQQASTGVLAHTPGGSGGRGASVHWLVPPNLMTRYPGSEGDLVDGQVTCQSPPGSILATTPPGMVVPSLLSATPESGMAVQHRLVQVPQQQKQQRHVQVTHQQHLIPHQQPQHEQQQHHQHRSQTQAQQQVHHQTVIQDLDPEATDVDITIEGEEGQLNAAERPKTTADGTGTEGEHVGLDGAGMEETIDITGGDTDRSPGGESVQPMGRMQRGEAATAALHDAVKNPGSKRRRDEASGAGGPTEHSLQPKKAKIMEMPAEDSSMKAKARKLKRERESDTDASAPKSGSYTVLLQEQQQVHAQ